MFTRNDLISYLSDLEMAETNMRDLYISAAQNVSDKTVKNTFLDLSKIESRHKELVAELRELAIGRSITEPL
jgi:rubrerythrin